jgi:hypothetical protein
MLDVNNVLPTPYQKVIERWRLLMFRRRRRRRKTKTKTKDENEDERRKRRRKTKTASIEKEQKERRKNISKQMCVSSQNIQYEKRRGRHRSGVSPTFPQLAVSQAGRAAFFIESLLYRKHPLNTANVLPSKRRRFQSSDWLSKTDDSNETNKMQMSLRTD